MKKSDFIKKVLRSRRNTVFVTKEQVANSLEIFESLGMIAPEVSPLPQNVIDNCESGNYWEPEDEKK